MLQRTSDPQNNNSSYESRPSTGDPNAGTGLDLRALLQIARRRASMVAAIALLFAVAAAIYALQLTPVYTARATLLLDPPKSDAFDTQAMMTGVVNDSAIDSQMEIIKTSNMAERVVNRLKLTELDGGFAANPSLVKQLIQAIFKREAVPNPTLDANPTARAVGSLRGSVAASRRGFSYI
jgi:uncharacterized protein involved in exopolysaccharide biosynthesis